MEEQIMQQYIGTKLINAVPMTRYAYNELRGWTVPENENPADDGYLVEYVDGGPSNHQDFKGYISWSPKEVFEGSYRQTQGLTFGYAIEALKLSFKVARKGWNGKGMFLVLIPGSTITISAGRPLAKVFEEGSTVEYLPHIDMKTVDDKVVPWLASQTDILAEDWCIVL